MVNEANIIGNRRLNPWRVAGWGLAVTLLLLPAVAMQFTKEVDWSGGDFLFMGALLGAIGLGIEFLVRQSENTSYRVGAVTALLTALLTVWVNLAVGMIGSEHNAYNLLFGGVLLVALIGSLVARYKAAGMARTMVAVAGLQVITGAAGLPVDERGAMFSMGLALLWAGSAWLFRKAARDDAARTAAT